MISLIDEYLKRQAKLIKVVKLGGGTRKQGKKGLDLLGGCNEVDTVRRFVKITLNDEDLVARSTGSAHFSRCEKVPKNGICFHIWGNWICSVKAYGPA